MKALFPRCTVHNEERVLTATAAATAAAACQEVATCIITGALSMCILLKHHLPYHLLGTHRAGPREHGPVTVPQDLCKTSANDNTKHTSG